MCMIVNFSEVDCRSLLMRVGSCTASQLTARTLHEDSRCHDDDIIETYDMPFVLRGQSERGMSFVYGERIGLWFTQPCAQGHVYTAYIRIWNKCDRRREVVVFVYAHSLFHTTCYATERQVQRCEHSTS